MSGKPFAIDLFCGLGGWTEGLLAEGFDVVGFDIEQHAYGGHRYPAQLVIQDVLTLHGAQFRDAALIVASPPCQAYSYRAMPWTRARALPPPDNTLFDSCFRIQREACEAAGRRVPLIVENVRGAQKWVGRARWNFGSFYLWGDVPALMPPVYRGRFKTHEGEQWNIGRENFTGSQGWRKVPGLDWGRYGEPGYRAQGFNVTAAQRYREGVKIAGHSGPAWFDQGPAKHSSKSDSRKAASAMIAKIPLPLSRHIARVYKP